MGDPAINTPRIVDGRSLAIHGQKNVVFIAIIIIAIIVIILYYYYCYGSTMFFSSTYLHVSLYAGFIEKELIHHAVRTEHLQLTCP